MITHLSTLSDCHSDSSLTLWQTLLRRGEEVVGEEGGDGGTKLTGMAEEGWRSLCEKNEERQWQD